MPRISSSIGAIARNPSTNGRVWEAPASGQTGFDPSRPLESFSPVSGPCPMWACFRGMARGEQRGGLVYTDSGD